MKAQFLKISGLSEKDFYKKYPTENHFFKAYPQMKKGGYLKKLDGGGITHTDTQSPLLPKNKDYLSVGYGSNPNNTLNNNFNLNFGKKLGKSSTTDNDTSFLGRTMLEGNLSKNTNYDISADLKIPFSGNTYGKVGVNNLLTGAKPFAELNAEKGWNFGGGRYNQNPIGRFNTHGNLSMTTGQDPTLKVGTGLNLNLGNNFGVNGNIDYSINKDSSGRGIALPNSNNVQGNVGLTYTPNLSSNKSSQEEQIRLAKIKNERIRNSRPNTYTPPHFAKGGRMSRYAQGTENPNDQYEVEKNEIVEGNDTQLAEGQQLSSDMHKVGGNTHENGGTVGQGGERVYSDRSYVSPMALQAIKQFGYKIPKGSKHAAAVEILAKKQGKYEEKSHAVNHRERNSNMIMLNRVKELQDLIFQDQEMQKGVVDNQQQQFRSGGNLRRYADGGEPKRKEVNTQLKPIDYTEPSNQIELNNPEGVFVPKQLPQEEVTELPTKRITNNLKESPPEFPVVKDFKINKVFPDDVIALRKEKMQNPKWKNFKGNYSVYSKENSKFYIFNNQHQLIDKTIAGRGQTKGDYPNSANLNDKVPKNATTPAGSFVINTKDTSYKPNEGYGKIVYGLGKTMKDINYPAAIHDVWGLNADNQEYVRRNKILNNPKIIEKLMSYGCINTPTGFLAKGNVNVGDSVFVTKEPMQRYAKGGYLPKRRKFAYGGEEDKPVNPYSNPKLYQYKANFTGTEAKPVELDLSTDMYNYTNSLPNASNNVDGNALAANAYMSKSAPRQPQFTKVNVPNLENGVPEIPTNVGANYKIPKQIINMPNSPMARYSPILPKSDYSPNIDFTKASVDNIRARQQVLIDKGLLKIDKPTGYWGDKSIAAHNADLASTNNVVTNTPAAPNTPVTATPSVTATNSDHDRYLKERAKDAANLASSSTESSKKEDKLNLDDNLGTMLNTASLINNLAGINKLQSYYQPKYPIAPTYNYNKSDTQLGIYNNKAIANTALKGMNRYNPNMSNRYATTAAALDANNNLTATENQRRTVFNNQVAQTNNTVQNERLNIDNQVNKEKLLNENAKIGLRNQAVQAYTTGQIGQDEFTRQLKLDKYKADLNKQGYQYAPEEYIAFINKSQDELKEMHKSGKYNNARLEEYYRRHYNTDLPKEAFGGRLTRYKTTSIFD